MKKEVKYGLTISAFTFCTPWMHWLAYQKLVVGMARPGSRMGSCCWNRYAADCGMARRDDYFYLKRLHKPQKGEK